MENKTHYTKELLNRLIRGGPVNIRVIKKPLGPKGLANRAASRAARARRLNTFTRKVREELAATRLEARS